MTQLDYHTALRYDTLELNKSSFTIQERWSISLERSKLLSTNNYRKSTITTATKKTVTEILATIKKTNWHHIEEEF